MESQIPMSHGVHYCPMGVWAGWGPPELALSPGMVRWIVQIFYRAGVTTYICSEHLEESPLVSAPLEKEVALEMEDSN